MRVFFFILISALISCSSPDKEKITVPKLHASFYVEAMDQINEKLNADPDNKRLVDQKLFYCEQLDWPATCISALDTHKEIHGMTNQLVKQYINYYKKHEQYDLLFGVLNRWMDEYELKDEFHQLYIKALVRSGKTTRAMVELRNYLISHNANEDFAFASGEYLQLKDTALAAYNLGKLYNSSPEHDLIWDYGIILMKLGYQEIGISVLEKFAMNHLDDFQVQLSYALALNEADNTPRARKVIKPFANQDTVAYLLADWYLEDAMWDSAGYVLTSVIEKDSTKRKPIWKAGRLYEDRGWYSTSMKYYEFLLELNPQDTLAVQRIDLIQRKIAYLQRLKFEESKIPVLELKSKKN
ncbi:hypothetical protein [Ekhidna sp.]|uniref:tetratricopeptide repeat protein n=1 Tax=Ekhidna sp. TaxID=2608089 RepID=UPI00329A6CCF